MRSERWYWLPGFCALALLIHVGILRFIHFFTPTIKVTRPNEIEVTLEPRQLPPQQVEPKPVVPPPKPKVVQPLREAPLTPIRIVRRSIPARPRIINVVRPRLVVRRPIRREGPVGPEMPDKTEAAREHLARLNSERPTIRALASSSRDMREKRLERLLHIGPLAGGGATSPTPASRLRRASPSPERPTEKIAYNTSRAIGDRLNPSMPRLGSPGTRALNSNGNLLAGTTLPNDRPTLSGMPGLRGASGTPGLRKLAKASPLAGGGSPTAGRN